MSGSRREEMNVVCVGDRDYKGERTGKGGGRQASWWQLVERPSCAGAELGQVWTVVLPDAHGQGLGTGWLSPSPRKEKQGPRQVPQHERTRMSIRGPGRNSAPEEHTRPMVAQSLSYRGEERVLSRLWDRKSHQAGVLTSLTLWPRLLWS